MWSMFRVEWARMLVQQFDVRQWWRPKLTARVVIMLAGIVIVWPVGLILGIILAPFLVILVGLVVTPIFEVQKRRMVAKARQKMVKFKGEVIGVTGSYGKSSTKEKIVWVLAGKYKVVKTPRNYNSLMGVAKTILEEIKGDEDFFVVEMGAYKRGEIKEICDLVKPKYGIVTGIGDQHLDLFGSLKNIRLAKMELIEALPKDGFGLVAKGDFRADEAKNIKQEIEGLAFEYLGQKFWLPIKGVDKIRNVMGTIKLTLKLGMNLKEIARRLKTFPPEELHPLLTKFRGNYLLDDSYNISLESALSVLEYMKVFSGYQKMVVTSGLQEIGERSGKDHRAIGGKMGECKVIVVTNIKSYNELKVSCQCQLETNSEEVRKIVVEWLAGEKKLVLFLGRSFSGLIKAIKDDFN